MSATRDSFRILHVDDEPDFADTTAAFLEREDDRFTVTTATSASDGLDLLGTHEVGCIVSDFLPDIVFSIPLTFTPFERS